MAKKGRSPKRDRAARPSTTAQSDRAKLLDDGPSEVAGFTPRTLDRSVIAIPLLRELVEEASREERELHDVVIDLHLEYPGGREKARERVRALMTQLPP